MKILPHTKQSPTPTPAPIKMLNKSVCQVDIVDSIQVSWQWHTLYRRRRFIIRNTHTHTRTVVFVTHTSTYKPRQFSSTSKQYKPFTWWVTHSANRCQVACILKNAVVYLEWGVFFVCLCVCFLFSQSFPVMVHASPHISLLCRIKLCIFHKTQYCWLNTNCEYAVVSNPRSQYLYLIV